MSLLNDVLRNVEQRKRDHPEGQEEALAITPAKRLPKARVYPAWLIISVVGILCAALSYVVLLSVTPSKPIHVVANISPAVTSPAVKNNAPLVIAAAQPQSKPTAAALVVVSAATSAPSDAASSQNTDSANIQTENKNPENTEANPAPIIAESIEIKMPRQMSLTEQDSNVSQTALTFIERNSEAAAERSLKSFIKKYPDALQSRALLANLWIQQNRLAEATSLLDEGLMRYPARLPFISLKSRILLATGKSEEALVLLLGVEKQSAQLDSDYITLLAAAYQQLGQFDQAVLKYQQLTNLQPDQAPHWLGLAICDEALGKHEAAQMAYRQVLRLASPDSPLYAYARKQTSS